MVIGGDTMGTLGRERCDGNVETGLWGWKRWDGTVGTGTLGWERCNGGRFDVNVGTGRWRWETSRREHCDWNAAMESVTTGTRRLECGKDDVEMLGRELWDGNVALGRHCDGNVGAGALGRECCNGSLKNALLTRVR